MLNLANIQQGQMVPMRDLMALDMALRKATEVGYQTPADVTVGGSISALVPQSIEDSLTSATHTMQHVVFWKDIPKLSINQTVHEYNVIQEHGADIDPFIAEGGAGVTDNAVYSRENVRVKFLAEKRKISDVAAMVGIVGPNPNAVAEETERGTENLMRKLEHQLFYGDENLSSLHFNGVFKQIEAGAPNNVTDMTGSGLDLDQLQAILGEVGAAPNFAMPDCMYVEPRVHQDLISLSRAHGRHDHLSVSNNAQITYGIPNLRLATPYGYVEIKSAPFLHRWRKAPLTPAGSSAKPATPAIAVQPAASGTSSNFTTSEAGDYLYSVVAFNADGYGVSALSSQVSVSAGQQVQIDLTAVADALYYKVYRTKKNDTTGTPSTYFLFSEKYNTNATAGGTRIIDTGAIKAGTSKALVIRRDPKILQFARLLPFIRRPLAETDTAKQFLLMLFGAPTVKVPSKCWVLDNVGTSTSV